MFRKTWIGCVEFFSRFGVAGTNILERFADAYGRDTGYALNGARQTLLGYDEQTGRLATMQTSTQEVDNHHSTTTTSNYNSFVWTYHPGSDLKSQLAYPNGLTASWTYDANNQLLQVCNATQTNVISQYDYAYDAAGRRIACARSGDVMSVADTIAYAYNARGELTNALSNVDANYAYTYQYDDIGNRIASCERGTNTTYAANELNQYTNIIGGPAASEPEFDDDGNQTLIRTATGEWRVTYNGENRPIRWTCLSATDTIATNGETIAMSYDRLGRRVTKNAERFVYDGYLQIANHRATTTTPNYNSFIWDPTEPVATRPLAWNSTDLNAQPSTRYYTHDGNKNVSEVEGAYGVMLAHYEYAPFGAAILLRVEYALANPWGFSSEYIDDEIRCDYFISRYLLPIHGRWLSKDRIDERGGINLYGFIGNMPLLGFDKLGENRYITQFDILGIGKSGGTQLHVGVAVDDWKCINGQWIKIGVITFNFGAKNDFLHRALASLWVLQGEIVESKGLNLQAPITLKSTPCQDLKMIESIRKEAKNPPFYNVLFYQCIFWSVGAVNYGM